MPEPPKHNLNIGGTLGELWCRLMHEASMWPIHGSYRCGNCGRSYPVPWAVERMRQPVLVAMPKERSSLKKAA
jgi:hypothetical protein